MRFELRGGVVESIYMIGQHTNDSHARIRRTSKDQTSFGVSVVNFNRFSVHSVHTGSKTYEMGSERIEYVIVRTHHRACLHWVLGGSHRVV